MFTRKTILVCASLLMIAAVAGGEQVFNVMFPLITIGVVATVGLPIATFFANLAWLLLFQPIYSFIPESKTSTRQWFRFLFAPPNRRET